MVANGNNNMAEGGSEENKNPFSFHNFVQSSGRQSKEECSDGKRIRESIFTDPDIGIPPRNEEGRPKITDEERLPKREENPFSFRQFLKKDSQKTKSKSYRHSASSQAAASVGLPDFVQGHFVSDHNGDDSPPSAAPAGRSAADGSDLPDFTINHHQDGATASERAAQCRSGSDSIVPTVEPSVKQRNVRRSAASGNDSSVTGRLPDFLSDGPMFGNLTHGAERRPNRCDQARSSSDIVPGEHSELSDGLREENSLLRLQLQQAQALLMTESEKVLELSKDVEILRKKEVDETKALENIVEDVENNLQSTAKRAIIAESTITKLRQETKLLQSQILMLSKENESLRAAGLRLDDVRDTANRTSMQITVAATTAENQLKQLLSGVSSLKILAACLANIDKLSEEDSSSANRER